MKNFLLFIIVFATHISWGQDETRTINNANFPVALYSGIPAIDIPLFTVNTLNSNFSLDLKLENNLYACTNKYLSTRGIGDGWALSAVGSITLKPENPWATSPPTYDETEYSRLLDANEDKDGHTVYTYSVLGLTGKFVIEKTGTTFDVKIKEQNDYATISVNYSASNNLFRLNSFTITDKNGFSYLFSDSDEEKTAQYGTYGSSTIYFDEKRTFFLSKITDKFSHDLLSYNYAENLTSINVTGKGIISLSPHNISKRTLTYHDLNNNLIQKIDFIFNQGSMPFGKILVTQVRFYNNTETTYKAYKISYKNYGFSSSTTFKEYVGFPYTACNNTWDWTASNINYDQGAVEKITTPEGGVTFYEYEPNTKGTGTPADMAGYDPEGPIYKDFFKGLRSKPENFTFEPIPLVYNATYGGYEVNFNNYIHPDDDKVIYVDYDVTPVEILPPSPLLPDGKYYTPGLQVEHYTTVPTGYEIRTVAVKECHPGVPVYLLYPQTKMMLKIETEYQSHYNFVRAYYKKPKPDTEFIYYDYNVGPRIKRIKTFSQNTASINATDHVVNEQLFNYELFNHPRTSSGNPLLNGLQPDYALYKNVTVETPGIGKTYYEFNDAGEGVSYTKENAYLFKYAKSIEKHNVQNQKTERIDFERNFSGTVLAYEKMTAESFENGAAQGLKNVTESVFDTITQSLVHRKITDVEAQTFEEQYTYQKLGSAYFRTAVEKTKNNSALNKSTFAYQQFGTTQAYNLKTVSVAKENRPLEVDKEITRYDEYGNILEYKTKDGLVISQVWGYNDSQLVAELKNIPYADIAAATIAKIRSYSDVAATTYNETNLITALNSLRNAHGTGYVTTYTYKPLVGITSLTDANGRKETYQYDSFNRLYRVLNHEGLVIKEYTYNIKN